MLGEKRERDGNNDPRDSDTDSDAEEERTYNIQVASNVAPTFDFTVEHSMTIGDTRGVLAAMLSTDNGDCDPKAIKISLKGQQLMFDDATWGSVGVNDGDKIFAVVAAPKKPGQTGITQGVAGSSDKEEARAAQQQMQMMEPMLDMMANNPAFLDSMIAGNPELQKMIRENPSVERELRNPDTLKQMMRAQIDPDARREMNQSMQMQLAQINSIPGGAQMLERYAGGMLRDTQVQGPRTAADNKEATEEHSRPKEGQTSNTEALPNPWARPQQQQQHQAMNPFGSMMGGMGAPQQQQQMMQMPFGFPQGPAGGAGGFGAAPPQGGMDPFAAMLGSMMGGGAPPAAAASVPQPVAPAPAPLTNEEVRNKWGSELATLRDMGFEDEALMIDALRACGGDVDGAVCYIAERQE